MRKPAIAFIVLLVLLIVLVTAGICFGSVKISMNDVLQAIISPKSLKSINPSSAYIIRNIRLPRVLCAIFAGMALAASGLVFQCVFRNPMADSYVLGISSGSSFAVGLSFIIGASYSSLSLPFWAFLGAIATTGLLFLISERNPRSLLMTGISLNFLLGALTSLTIYLSPNHDDTIFQWTMGSLGNSSWQRAIVLGITALTTETVLLYSGNSMDLLLMDDSTAISSGLNTSKARILLLILASLTTSVVVSYCGIIGFVGLMSPHFIRLFTGPRHKTLIPLSMLLGADILLFSDLISRVIIAPSQLPIGITTAIMGAPVFLVLLRRKNNG